MYLPTTMYLVEVLALVYISHLGNAKEQFSLPHPEAELSASAGLVLCV